MCKICKCVQMNGWTWNSIVVIIITILQQLINNIAAIIIIMIIIIISIIVLIIIMLIICIVIVIISIVYSVYEKSDINKQSLNYVVLNSLCKFYESINHHSDATWTSRHFKSKTACPFIQQLQWKKYSSQRVDNAESILMTWWLHD